MGCDIHLRLERKAKGNTKWENCEILGCDHCWGERIYGMFAVLAGVRNYNKVEHLPVRGIPQDVTRRTLLHYGYEVVENVNTLYDWQMGKSQAKHWVENGCSEYFQSNGTIYCSNPDWHTPSWCTTTEMEDCINRIFKNEEGGYKGDYSEWLALLGAMKGYEADGSECRAVFWFDN